MAFVNLLKSWDVLSTFVPRTGNESMAPLKLRRLSVLTFLNCLRLQYLLLPFLFLFLLVALLSLLLLLLLVSGLVVLAGTPSVALLDEMFEVVRVTVCVLAVDNNADPMLSDLGHARSVSTLSNPTTP